MARGTWSSVLALMISSSRRRCSRASTCDPATSVPQHRAESVPQYRATSVPQYRPQNTAGGRTRGIIFSMSCEHLALDGSTCAQPHALAPQFHTQQHSRVSIAHVAVCFSAHCAASFASENLIRISASYTSRHALLRTAHSLLRSSEPSRLLALSLRCAHTLQTQIQETAFLVQNALRLRFLAFDFGVYLGLEAPAPDLEDAALDGVGERAHVLALLLVLRHQLHVHGEARLVALRLALLRRHVQGRVRQLQLQQR
eukprot:1053329-Rhodomonas_salina.1